MCEKCEESEEIIEYRHRVALEVSNTMYLRNSTSIEDYENRKSFVQARNELNKLINRSDVQA
jgi:hypothetical protein